VGLTPAAASRAAECTAVFNAREGPCYLLACGVCEAFCGAAGGTGSGMGPPDSRRGGLIAAPPPGARKSPGTERAVECAL
jgi:hypothetical protein